MDESVHLSWSVRLQIALDIVQGMVYLHSKNVFHRDLNPKVSRVRLSVREREREVRGGREMIEVVSPDKPRHQVLHRVPCIQSGGETDISSGQGVK